MDCAATQIYEEEDFECTQRISQTFEEKELIQVGVLSIDSTEYQIKNQTTKIGRLSSCDICIDDMTVSKIHAEIEADTGQGSTWISDLSSANKTKLNNSVLRPKRLYELKDGSVIEFGKVRAIYRTYRPTHDIVIPETPASTRQKVAGTIIPNTPDSSINNSSAADNDESVIFGTQTEEKKSVFRQPLLPQQRQSTSIDKKNTCRGASMSESDDSQIDIRLRVSINDSSESEGVSIHDMETQNIPMDASKHLEANIAIKKPLSTLNLRDKMAGNSTTNINDMENYMDDNKQQRARKGKIDISNTTAKKSTTNIHDLETQNYIVDTTKSNIDIQDATARKSVTNIHDLETQNYVVDSAKNNTDIRDATTKKFATNIYDLETQNYLVDAGKNIQDATAKKSTTNIYDLETQNYLVDTKTIRNITVKKSAMNIHDLETQNYIVDNIKSNTGTHKLGNDKNKARTKNVGQVEHNIHDLETQKLDNERTVKDIYDMETQSALDGTTNESNNSRVDKNNKNKDISNAPKSETSCENTTKLPSSRSSSLESLNLSSPGIDENCPSSPLNESAHLLESSDLLEYFADGIDKPKECNASTPKPKTSSQKDNAGNMADMSDDENDNQEDNIHDLPTQCINSKLNTFSDSETDKDKAVAKRKVPKKKLEEPRSTQVNDDSETDAEEYLEELAKKQNESLAAPSKSRDTNVENNNDLETSADSDDMFNMLTQEPQNHSTKNTSSSPINQQPKTNQTYAVVDDTVPMQKIDVKDKHDRDDRSDVPSADIDDTALTQPLLPRKAPLKTAINSKNSSLENNQTDVDDTAPTQIIHANVNVSKSDNCCTSSNLDSEDIAYETAPTQLIDEVIEKGNSTRRTSDDTKAAKSSKVDLNDTLERNLNEMFDDVNSDSVHEHALMSTQCLEDILQASQCDNDLLPNKSTVEEKAPTDNIPEIMSRKKSSRLSRNVVDSEVDKNNVNENDSQNSDIYFATITTRRKRNIIKDTQDILDSTKDITSSRQVPNIPQKSKMEIKNDNLATKSNKKGKRIAKSKSKINATTDDLIDDTASKTTSNENDEKIVRKTKSVKQKSKTASKTNGEISKEPLCEGEVEVDHAEGKNLTTNLGICSSSGQDAQRLDILLESDNDILTRLPAVRISGTLSNPPSPSASSTSTIYSARSNRSNAKGRKKDGPSKSKPLRTRNVEKPSRTDNKSPLLSHDNYSSRVTLETLKIDTISEVANDSEDSDSSSKYRRFKQMADRMLGKECDDLKKQSKVNKTIQSASKSISDKEKKDARSSLDLSKNWKQSSDLEGLRNPARRATRSSSRQDNESSSVQLTKETRAKGAVDKFTKPETKPGTKSAANRKRNLNIAEENTEQTSSKKHKVDEVIGEATKITSRETRGTSDMKTENINATSSSVTRTRRKVTDSQAATPVENTNKNKRTQGKEKEILASQVTEKTLKVVLHPIIVDNESREVEMIMMRNVPSDARNENSSVREGSNARIFERASSSRSIRSKKRANTNATTDSSSIESSISSDTSDLESVQSGSIAPTRAKRGRSAKNSVPSPQGTSTPENEVFKRPIRVNRYSANLTDNIIENSISDDSRSSTPSNGSLSIRFSRSKTAGTKSTWKVQMNESLNKKRMTNANVSSEMNMNIDSSTFCVSTPTRTRRSASSMSISSPSTMKHRILFTGITEDRYDNVIKTLGGSKVETPKLCTVLVTDKVRRTYKFLCALAKGLPIVSINWLNDSESAAQFLDWESYILKDRIAEAKFGFRLRKSLDRAKEKGLLVGYTIVLTPNIEQPPTKELKDMIMSCGGKALLSPPTIWPENAIIISRTEDLSNAKKYLMKAPKTITVQSTEFILIGILRQEMDFDKHRLI